MTPRSSNPSDDFIEIVENTAPAEPVAPAESASPSQRWRLLVVDDDEDVHRTTRFALDNAEILGSRVELFHAHSAADARKILSRQKDVAVALIDVVMETPDAGLNLVSDLRRDGHHETRIILRTGQPGYAPELSVIANYEIDDYRTKSELTRTRLLTVLTASIRAYHQIRKIGRSRAGLEMIVESATSLFRRTNLELFSRGVLTQIAALLGVAPNGVVCVGPDDGTACHEGRIVSGTGRFGKYLGMSPAMLDDPDVSALIREACQSPAPIQKGPYMGLHFQRDTGEVVSVIVEASGELTQENLSLLKLFSTNIAIGFDNLTLVERLDRLAYVDPVLNIPNLNAFEAALERWREHEATPGRIALVNIDSLHSVTALHGSRVAHGLMALIYDALRAGHDGKKSTIARVGDGCFAILGRPEDLDENRISEISAHPYCIEGVEIATTVTASLIDIENRCEDASSIMRMANAALLHVAQARPGNCVFYDTTMQAEVEDRVSLQVGLKRVIERGEGLSVHLQPKVDLHTREVVGAEALLRWQFNGQAVSPARFIPIAEAAGLTPQLTDFVIASVAKWARGRSGRPAVPVAINLSMADLNTPGFADRVLAKVREEGGSPSTISFEVTEGIAMQEKPWAIEQLRILRAAGFQIALDDFGTGYSSLGYFSRLPVDTLKIDKAFVTPLDVRTARESLAGIVLGMADSLKVNCIAEGVETAEQEQALQFLGCKFAQGYFFGRPVPSDEFDQRFLDDV